jgi:hypothetical protein
MLLLYDARLEDPDDLVEIECVYGLALVMRRDRHQNRPDPSHHLDVGGAATSASVTRPPAGPSPTAEKDIRLRCVGHRVQK